MLAPSSSPASQLKQANWFSPCGAGSDSRPTAGQVDWCPPSELPDLRRIGVIAIDTETCDEGLRADRGSAWPWRGGYVCGISVAWRDDGEIRAHYFPLRHPDSENFERENVARWLKDHIAAGVKFTTQNGIYDWGWLGADLGVAMPPSDQLDEIGALATLVDENLFQYSLDALCKQYGLPGKDETLLRQAIETAGFASGRKKINAREYIWQLPARYVGPYAETDAVRTLELYEMLTPIIEREGTRDAYRLDVDLMPMVLEMRRRGIRIDQVAAEQARDLLARQTRCRTGRAFGAAWHGRRHGRDQWSQMERADLRSSTASNIRAPQKGNPSFAAGKVRMDGHARPLAAAADRDREQIRRREAPSFSKGISSTTSSTGAFTPRFIHSAPTMAARARRASPIPIRRCSRCRCAIPSWGR